MYTPWFSFIRAAWICREAIVYWQWQIGFIQNNNNKKSLQQPAQPANISTALQKNQIQ